MQSKTPSFFLLYAIAYTHCTSFNLPPTEKARPLPVISKNKQANGAQTGKKKNNARKQDDDVPRAFKRLMAISQGKKVRSGLDNGDGNKVTRKDAPAETPRIQPGENMRDFAARVNAALPISGLTKKTVIKDGKDEAGLKVRRTRKERKMHKLYDQWHEEERKIQDKREEEAEEEAERELENDAAGITSSTPMFDFDEASTKKSRKRRGKAEEDPWLEVKRRRAEAKVGLHDVALAPPQLHKKFTRQLKVEGAAVDVDGIPKSSGSLRRREELQGIRTDVLEAYRKIREHEQSKLMGS